MSISTLILLCPLQRIFSKICLVYAFLPSTNLLPSSLPTSFRSAIRLRAKWCRPIPKNMRSIPHRTFYHPISNHSETLITPKHGSRSKHEVRCLKIPVFRITLWRTHFHFLLSLCHPVYNFRNLLNHCLSSLSKRGTSCGHIIIPTFPRFSTNPSNFWRGIPYH